jgi:tellurite resistance protein TerC
MISILVFAAVVAVMIWLDLRGHKNKESVSLRGAALWSAIWVGVSLLFAGYLYLSDGADKAGLFLAGYLLEKSLSVDNLFVIMAVFASFKIKDAQQHRVLYYGILGAIVFRLFFIALGSAFLLASNLNPIANMVVYSVFGALVLYSAFAMVKAADNDPSEDYTRHWSVRFFRDTLRIPVWDRLSKDKFLVRIPSVLTAKSPTEIRPKRGKVLATPLLLCLIVVETSDIAFAFDSVPAVIAITKDPFLVYSSNIFAILGLRSMYFLLVAAKKYLCHLEKAVVGILIFIGLKMFLEAFHGPLSKLLGINIHIPVAASLSVVVGGLFAGIVASYLYPIPTRES